MLPIVATNVPPELIATRGLSFKARAGSSMTQAEKLPKMAANPAQLLR
jgi:hypothetical protein